MSAVTYQTVVYGDSEAAIMAAIGSTMAGATTALVVPPPPGFTTSHPGGSMVNGLGATDTYPHFVNLIGSGPAGEFFRRNTLRYGSRTQVYRLEPHAAEETFRDMLASVGVDVWVDAYLVSVSKTGTTINSFTDSAGNVFSGTNFIDCTYEGDLAAMAGITMTVGRESSSAFLAAPPAGVTWIQATEPIGGFNPSAAFGFDNSVPVNPYDSNGTLLPGVSPFPALGTGAADGTVMAGGYRVCLSMTSTNAIPFRQPAGYDESLFELSVRGLAEGSVFLPTNVPNGKYDLNTDYVQDSADPTGGPVLWATGTMAQRAAIGLRMFNYLAGYLWWQQNSPDAPVSLQNSIIDYGLPRDEFTNNTVYAAGWPRLPYIREARRMIGQYVMTYADMKSSTGKVDSIGMGGYSFDDHPHGNYPQGSGYIIDGGAQLNRATRGTTNPYQIPFRSMLPRTTECANLLVPVAASLSQVAFRSYRIVGTWMGAGVAAGVAAGRSATLATPLNSLVVADLQTALVSFGQVIAYP